MSDRPTSTRRSRTRFALVAVPLLALPMGTAIAGPKAPTTFGKRKPVASASASASSSASAAASASPASSASGGTSATSTVSAPLAPTGSAAPIAMISGSAVSPLTPRTDEAPPIGAASSTKPSASYDEVMAEIAALRARVSAVGNAVWKSRMAVRIRTTGGHAKLASARMLLDGAPVWVAPKGFASEDYLPIFDGGVAPGLHSLTIEIERRDDRDETYRTIDRTTSTVTVPNGKRLEVDVRLDDDSTMGGEFPGDSVGRYDLRVRMNTRAATVK